MLILTDTSNVKNENYRALSFMVLGTNCPDPSKYNLQKKYAPQFCANLNFCNFFLFSLLTVETFSLFKVLNLVALSVFPH